FRIGQDFALLWATTTGHENSFLFSLIRNTSGAYSCELFRPLGAIFGARLAAVLDPLRVEDSAKHVIAHTRKIADTTATDQHDAVLLEVVAFTRNVANDFALVGQADLGNLAQCRVRLLRGGRIDTGADAALL